MNADRANKEQLIKELQERLDWYTFEATEDEFDEKEVEALVQLLGVMKGEETVPVEIPDFEDILGSMVTKQTALDTEVSEVSGSVADEKKVHRFAKKRFPKVAAAILALIILAGGTMGVVSAQKGEGFFHWLKRDETGEQILISQQGNDDDGKEVYSYSAESEIPERYQEFLLGVETFESLQGYEINSIEIRELEKFLEICYSLGNQPGKEVVIKRHFYDNLTMMKQESYGEYDYLKEETIGEKNVMFFTKKNDDGEMDYLFSVYYENSQLLISGNYPLEIMEGIVRDCINATK